MRMRKYRRISPVLFASLLSFGAGQVNRVRLDLDALVPLLMDPCSAPTAERAVEPSRLIDLVAPRKSSLREE